MPIATGHSNIREEIKLMNITLANMINSIEIHFRQEIDSLKANIYDIFQTTLSDEEKISLSNPFCEKLEESETMLHNARNKLIICIFSICEASLAGICNHYRIPLKRSPHNKSKNFYLTDYLFSLGVDYTTKDKKHSAYVVHKAIRPLRNYLTHSKEDILEATTVVNGMTAMGFTKIEHCFGRILIQSNDTLKDILFLCNDMLLNCEQIAINNRLK